MAAARQCLHYCHSCLILFLYLFLRLPLRYPLRVLLFLRKFLMLEKTRVRLPNMNITEFN